MCKFLLLRLYSFTCTELEEDFLVFKFPIKDEINFAFQANEYDYLKELLPNWLTNKDNWSENQTIRSITIGRVLQIDEFYLDSLKHYIETFKNSRIQCI